MPVNAIVRLPIGGADIVRARKLFSTLRSKGYSRSKAKWWAIYTNVLVNAIVKLLHPRSRDSLDQEKFLALSTYKQTHNCDKESSNHHPSLSTLRWKRLSCSKMTWWAIYTNLSKFHSQTRNFFSTCWNNCAFELFLYNDWCHMCKYKNWKSNWKVLEI